MVKKIILLWLLTRIVLFLTVGSIAAWNQGDVHFYLEIAATGYEPGFLSNCGWCPGFPLLLKLAPIHLTNALLINNLILLAALFTVDRLNRLDHTPEQSWSGLLLLVAFPSAYFLAAPLSESTFLLCSAGAFWAARQKHWPLAGLLGGAATLTRVQGLLLLPALLLEKPTKKQTLALTAIPIGQLLFNLHLQAQTGDFWAYFHVQQRLERHISGWILLQNGHGLAGPHWVGIAYAATALLLLKITWKQLRHSERLYCLASLLLPFYHSFWVSTGRLMIVLTPLFTRTAAKIAPRTKPWILATLAILQLILTALYSLANPYVIY